MKLFALALTIALSTTVSAAQPVTEAIKNILPAGTYEGVNCSVLVETKADSISVSIKNNSLTEVFGLANSAKGIVINDVTGEISATQSLNYPHYLKGGTKFLNIKGNDIDQVSVSISKILVDHRGNDASTYTECAISL